MRLFTHTSKRPLFTALAAAAALTAGCGGDERAVQRGNRKTCDCCRADGQRGVSAGLRDARATRGERSGSGRGARSPRAAATIERREADKLAAIKPPTDSAAAINGFVRAARSQAAALHSSAARADLTVAEMADAVELPQMRQALTELDRQNLAKPPAHQ